MLFGNVPVKNSITVGIPTKDRYDMLSQTLLSIALQTHKPVEVIIVDDSNDVKDIRDIPSIASSLNLFEEYSIRWQVIFGQKKGQHYSHQLVQEKAKGDLVFRIDDDEVAEPTTLSILRKAFSDDKVGAVAPAVMLPKPSPLPNNLKNIISDLSLPNCQWFKGIARREAEHLYSCFMYRKGLVKYDLNLSTVCHREETIFTHSIMRLGYKLLVDSTARVWHFRAEKGGIRSFNDPGLWEHDEKIFNSYLELWGVKKTNSKVVVLDCGLGDHYAFKNIIPELKEKYDNVTVACCYPEAFHDEDLNLISIADAQTMYGNIETFNIYRFMENKNWKKTLTEAFRELYINQSL